MWSTQCSSDGIHELSIIIAVPSNGTIAMCYNMEPACSANCPVIMNYEACWDAISMVIKLALK